MMRALVAALLLPASFLLGASQVQVDESYQRFATAFAALDADRVATVYAEDAMMLPPGGEIVRGRARIREHYAQGFEEDRERGHTRSIRFELVERLVSGDVRNDYGYYTITARNPSGREREHRGKFAKVWRRGADGVWRIWSDSYSSAPAR